MASLWRPGVILPIDKLTPSIIEEIKTALTSEQTVALTAWREAESRLEKGKGWVPNPPEAMRDIMNVIRNRSVTKGLTVKGVCLKKAQFSCWAPVQGAGNFATMMDNAQKLMAGQVATGMLAKCLEMAREEFPDALQGATHYYAPASMVPPGSVPPWAVAPAQLVHEAFGHKFYNNVKW